MEDKQCELLMTISHLEELQKSLARAICQALGAISLARPIPAPRFTVQPAAPSTPVPATPQYCPDAERLVDVIHLALPIQPQTPAGKVAYQVQVAKWSAQNGDHPVNKMRPYLLSPGTSPVASGKCWKCRYTGHHGPDCLDPNPVPVIKQKWRSIAATSGNTNLALAAVFGSL